MSGNKIDEAVDILLKSHENMERFAGFPASCAPLSVEDGYAVQDAFSKRLGAVLAGWKVGATDHAIQQMFSTDEPFYGPVYVTGLVDTPAAIDPARHHALGLECEFAFSFARGLEPGDAPLSQEQVVEAVHTLFPAVEIVSPRLDDLTAYGVASVIADGAIHGGLVIGRDVHDWRGLDLTAQAMRLEINGEKVANGTGARVLGGPLGALTWFVNRHLDRGQRIMPGAVVTTGTCTGVVWAAPGDTVTANFGALGSVEIEFAEASPA